MSKKYVVTLTLFTSFLAPPTIFQATNKSPVACARWPEDRRTDGAHHQGGHCDRRRRVVRSQDGRPGKTIPVLCLSLSPRCCECFFWKRPKKQAKISGKGWLQGFAKLWQWKDDDSFQKHKHFKFSFFNDQNCCSKQRHLKKFSTMFWIMQVSFLRISLGKTLTNFRPRWFILY